MKEKSCVGEVFDPRKPCNYIDSCMNTQCAFFRIHRASCLFTCGGNDNSGIMYEKYGGAELPEIRTIWGSGGIDICCSSYIKGTEEENDKLDGEIQETLNSLELLEKSKETTRKYWEKMRTNGGKL